MDKIESMLSGITGRAVRSILTLAISTWIAHNQNNQYYLAAAPLLQIIGKTLRDKWPGKFEWLPI